MPWGDRADAWIVSACVEGEDGAGGFDGSANKGDLSGIGPDGNGGSVGH